MQESLKNAFRLRPRINFLPEDVSQSATFDRPLPIGFGQTNSQPSLVYKMLELLDLKPGQKVLDVGCGSGWTTSLISHLIGKEGQVYGTEIIPELAEFATKNCKKYLNHNLKILNTPSQLGYPKKSPYDRILVSAEAQKVPEELIQQLSEDSGRMVLPVEGELLVITKNGHDLDIKKVLNVMFVPLIY